LGHLHLEVGENFIEGTRRVDDPEAGSTILSNCLMMRLHSTKLEHVMPDGIRSDSNIETSLAAKPVSPNRQRRRK
jgi:hypothetical protein